MVRQERLQLKLHDVEDTVYLLSEEYVIFLQKQWFVCLVAVSINRFCGIAKFNRGYLCK